MTSPQLILTALFVLAIVLHQCSGKQGCEPKKMTEIKHSLKRPASAYINAVHNEFRITKVFTKRFKSIPNFANVVSEYIESGFSFWKKVMKPKLPTVGRLKVVRKCPTDWHYLIPEKGVEQRYCDKECLPEVKCQQYVVPREYREDCRYVVDGHKYIVRDGGAGASSTDLLVFVDYTQTGCGNDTIAFAGPCQQNAESDRPEVAYLNYCPMKAKFIPEKQASLNTTTIHELGHILGFTSSLYAFMRDKDGKARTRRQETGVIPDFGFVDGIYKPDTKTLGTRQKLWLTDKGIKYKTVYILKTENLIAAARKHFGCNTLTGVDLETNEGDAVIGSHWKMSLFNDEVLVATRGKGYVSELTLAFMNDTGWYDVDMSAAEILPWSYKKGCEFARWNCAAYIQFQYRKRRSLQPWCREVHEYCQPDGTYCDLEAKVSLPDDLTYFKWIKDVPRNETNKYAGTDKLMDYCPRIRTC